ncbi:4-(cytidine 5'-diphospho)-2-C-methyl-D-erythritol kinase [bacterium]|nr:4-(cytidine 5'-diphospho)-2-C-methyl-D-erythritol kinase [bacterium]
MNQYHEKINSNAKLNIYLEIVGKKDNGYHLLETIMVPISLYDTLDIKITQKKNEYSDIQIDCNIIPKEDNILYKAAKIVLDQYKLPVDIEIKLDKNIPIGGGLGGGSGDCAAFLKKINEWYQFATEKELLEIALSLGADVPFFLLNKPAFCEGVGEICREIKIPKNLEYYLILSDIHSSTPQAFKEYSLDINKTSPYKIPKEILDLEFNQKLSYSLKDSNNIDYFLKNNYFIDICNEKFKIDKNYPLWSYLSQSKLLYFNRLESYVIKMIPQIKNSFPNTTTPFMSGSGSTFYIPLSNEIDSKNSYLKKVKIL